MRCVRCGAGWNPSELGLVAALLRQTGVLGKAESNQGGHTVV